MRLFISSLLTIIIVAIQYIVGTAFGVPKEVFPPAVNRIRLAVVTNMGQCSCARFRITVFSAEDLKKVAGLMRAEHKMQH